MIDLEDEDLKIIHFPLIEIDGNYYSKYSTNI